MPTDPQFRMYVQDVFLIRGRGTIVTGCIDQGTLAAGDIVGLRGPDYAREVEVVAIEMYRRPVDRAEAGQIVGLVLKDIAKDEVQRGDLLAGSEWGLGDA